MREGAPLVAEQLGGNQRWWNRGYLTGDGTLAALVWVYLKVVPYQGNDLLEFLGNGDGTFATPKVVLSNLSSLSVVDVNHDGVLDVIESRDALATDLNAGSPVEVLPILAPVRHVELDIQAHSLADSLLVAVPKFPALARFEQSPGAGFLGRDNAPPLQADDS